MTKQLSTGLIIAEEKEERFRKLGVKFQLFARRLGCNDNESLAAYIDADKEKALQHFQSIEEFEGYKETGNEKLKGIKSVVL